MNEQAIYGSQLRTARLAEGMSQQDLADRCGVSLRTIGSWERSDRPLPARAVVILRKHAADVLEETYDRNSDSGKLLAEERQAAYLAGYNTARIQSGLPPHTLEEAAAYEETWLRQVAQKHGLN